MHRKMQKEQCFELGIIQKTKGLQGELVILLDVDEPEAYQKLESVLIEIKAQLIPYFITEIYLQGDKAFVHFEDIDHIDKAKPFVGAKVYLPLSQLPALEEGEFYLHDLIGFQLIDEQKGELGKIENVYEGHQDILIFLYQGKEILLPMVDAFIKEINSTQKTMLIQLPDGLLDVYLGE